MNKIFDNNPKIENTSYKIRLIRRKDLTELLELYSNKENIKFINIDDNNNDPSFYITYEQILEKYNFWKFSYKNKWFARLSIIDKNNKKVIGSIELLKHRGYDSFKDALIIKMDLLLNYEKKEIIKDVYSLLYKKLLNKVEYSKIATKITPNMQERKEAFIEFGFKLSNRNFIGSEDNKIYKNYYVGK